MPQWMSKTRVTLLIQVTVTLGAIQMHEHAYEYHNSLTVGSKISCKHLPEQLILWKNSIPPLSNKVLQPQLFKFAKKINDMRIWRKNSFRQTFFKLGLVWPIFSFSYGAHFVTMNCTISVCFISTHSGPLCSPHTPRSLDPSQRPRSLGLSSFHFRRPRSTRSRP